MHSTLNNVEMTVASFVFIKSQKFHSDFLFLAIYFLYDTFDPDPAKQALFGVAMQ